MSTVGVRYIVDDVDKAITFYTQHLGFSVELHPAPGFATLSLGDLRLLLNAPGAGGAGQAMPDGRHPEPGGWNRIQLQINDLSSNVLNLHGTPTSTRFPSSQRLQSRLGTHAAFEQLHAETGVTAWRERERTL